MSDAVPATALAGGVGIYFLAHVGLAGGLGHGRHVATLACLAVVPVATTIDALATLAAVAAACIALIAYEVTRRRNDRATIRSQHRRSVVSPRA